MVERVVVPLDGSRLAERALDAAASLVRPANGVVILAHAVSALPGALGRNERRVAETYLRGAAARLRRRGVRVELRIGRGEPSRALRRIAEREDADLLAMTCRGRGGSGGWPLGSVAQRLLQTSLCPILLFRSGAGTRRRIRRVLATLHGKDALHGMFPLVGEIASAVGAEVEILQVGHRSASILRRAVDVLARLDVPPRVHVRGGPAGPAIRKMARSIGADLIAIAARRSDRSVVRFGRLAEEVFRDPMRPLLVVPAGGAA